MKRILHIVGRMNRGGAETFIMNMYRNIDKDKFQFDFIVHVNEESDYDEEIKKLGGNIYHVTPKNKNLIKNLLEIKGIVKNNRYLIIHRHTNSAIVSIDLIMSKLGGAKKLITHSHSTNTEIRSIHYLSRKLVNKYTTDRIACSIAAGEWLFGNKDFKVINNGINTKDFVFNNNIRNEMRKELGLTNEFVVGHVGRFDKVKNHQFLLKIFNEICKKIDNAVLIMVGQGELENEIKLQVKNMNLEDKVKFTGLRKDINNLMQVMDAFILPSLHEGLPVVLVEAQAAGLKCFASSTVSNESKITEEIQYLSLDRSEEYWADKIINNAYTYKRKNRLQEIIDYNYDIKNIIKDIEELYTL